MQTETFQKNRSLSVLQKYASEIGLDKKTGIEITESRTLMCQIPTQSRLISDRVPMLIPPVSWHVMQTAIATSGNVYDLTLLDRQTDSKGNTLKKYEPDNH